MRSAGQPPSLPAFVASVVTADASIAHQVKLPTWSRYCGGGLHSWHSLRTAAPYTHYVPGRQYWNSLRSDRPPSPTPAASPPVTALAHRRLDAGRPAPCQSPLVHSLRSPGGQRTGRSYGPPRWRSASPVRGRLRLLGGRRWLAAAGAGR